jgi:cytochrome P450
VTVVITDYAGAMDALRQRDLRQSLYDEGAVVMDRVLVNLHGEDHRRRRTVESQVFRRDFFRYYETEVFPGTLEDCLTPYLATGRLDLVEFGYRVLVNLTADFTGIDRSAKSAEETETLMAMLRLFSRTAILAHSTVDRDAIRREALDALGTFEKQFVEPSVARRAKLLGDLEKGRLTEGELPRDILMVLLRQRSELDLPDDVLTREMAFYALAGAHTSIHSLTHAVHEIFQWAADPSILVDDPLLLQRCVLESFRLHPSSPVAARRSLCPVTLDTASIDEGEVVEISLQMANRDERVFGTDAATFNPLRGLGKGINPYGLSFGMGMHACLGLNLAAGTLPRADTDAAQHHYGTVTLIIRELLAHGLRPDPKRPPAKDATTARDLWGTYPTLLDAP